jgi:hypothetical protein
MTNEITSKNIKKFYCESCDFKCDKKGDYNRHLHTVKHQALTYPNKKTSKNIKLYECECGNSYKHASSLCGHKKKCSIVQGKEKSNTNNTNTTNKDGDEDMDVDKKFLVKMLLKNQDVMDKLMEIMPLIGNQNNNTNSLNTTNNQFNIQMFLNDHCKDAMNLTDFIQSLPITAETYDHTIENGLTKSITKMMVTGLSEMDILQRPIHCTDASRKTLYVKDNDIWEKDNELLHMLKGIQDLSFKQRVNIHKWQDENEGWDVKDDLQTKITMLVFHTMTDLDNDVKETRKIISAISKNTYLTHEIKNQYLS